MEYAVCLHSVVPVRAEPGHRSEMVTQILFGELYEILSYEHSWAHIRLAYDGYEGWIDEIQVSRISSEEFMRLTRSETRITLDLVQLLSQTGNGNMLPVVLGSSLPGFQEPFFSIGETTWQFDGMVSESVFAAGKEMIRDREQLIGHLAGDAMMYMKAPYLWGGRTPFGIDCSGFVQMVYKLRGIALPRDAWQQASAGEIIGLPGEALAGDLAFFDNAEGKIIHVGILLENRKIIHCSGEVRIDALDQEGIYHSGMKKYTHRLRLIKRILA